MTEQTGTNPSPKLLLAVIGITVLGLGVGLYVVNGDEGGPSCLVETAEHLPEDRLEDGFLQGGDQERARAAGFDDSAVSSDPEALEEFHTARLETGVVPDLLTLRATAGFADPVEQNGYGPDDVNCWVDGNSAFAATGSFDEDAVAASVRGQDGDVVATSDLVVRDTDGDPSTMLDQQSTLPPEMSQMLDALDDREAVSFAITMPDNDRPSVAVASTHDDGWELLIVWLFDDSSTREEAEAAVTRLLDEGEGSIPDLISGGTDGILSGSGPMLVLQAPLTDPGDWVHPMSTLDPLLNPLDDGD